ncbi:MAG: SIS domain-containing protein [Clostridia bacterium]|nr:SIS domain-containing protein [Clostridia bacterium]
MDFTESLKDFIIGYPALEPCCDDIASAFNALKKCYENGGKVLACGNGGSAADCEHIVGELMKGFESHRPLPNRIKEKFSSLPDGEFISGNLQGTLCAISLVSQPGLISAFANDAVPELVYAQQVLGYGKKGDVLIALSTSGNSANVVYATETAKTLGLTVVTITGKSGGKLSEISDVTVKLPADKPKDVQELTLPVYHFLCLSLEQFFFG